MPMASPMIVLVFAGLVRSIAATSGYVFYGVGKPKIDTALQIARLSVLAILIYPFTIKWGILGASVVVFLSIFISNIGFSFMVLRITKCATNKFSQMIIFPSMGGISLVSSILLLKTYVNITGIWGLLLSSIVGISSYFGIIYLLDRFSSYGMRTLIGQALAAKGT